MSNRVFIKGFDKNLKSQGYQFEIGKEYKIDLPEGHKVTRTDIRTNKVFRVFDSLNKAYYALNQDETFRFCIVEVVGQLFETGGGFLGSDHIRIVREIGVYEAEKIIELSKEKQSLADRISELEAENAKLIDKINDIKRFVNIAL